MTPSLRSDKIYLLILGHPFWARKMNDVANPCTLYFHFHLQNHDTFCVALVQTNV